MYMWLYKKDLASGVMVRLDEVDEYIKDGWLDTPDKWGKKGVVAVKGWDYVTPVGKDDDNDEASLKNMDEKELVIYAKEQFGVKIDKRKSKPNMIKQIEAL